MSLKAWHKLIDPREDLRDGKPLDAAEFAVQLDLVRDESEDAPDEYKIPSVFFQRTYLTQNLTQLASEVMGRLSGEIHGANAIFNLTTQFGGGKTHALTLLYHLATHGPEAVQWFGVDQLLKVAKLSTVPKATTAVFVGSEFDSIKGRGGKDGTPLRTTPWGEIAFQIRGEEGFNLVAEHDSQRVAPGGDVIRELLPKHQPCLILLDELIHYVSRARKQGWADQVYNFIQSLIEAVRARDKAVLVVSLPKATNELNSEDEASDFQRFLKLLERVSKPVAIASETEVSEIIRRRLFEWDQSAIGWDGKMILNAEQKAVCKAYAQWITNYRGLLSPEFAFDQAQQEFEATYPFHPVVISLFQRKWRSLPQFQQTRGILKLLAQWVSEAFKSGYKKAHPDLLIGLGTAPLENLSFRDSVTQQLNEDRLKAVITTDITDRPDAHADYLDRQADEDIKKRRLHRKIATAILFESNGGQTDARASLPEIRLAVGEPDLEIAEVEPALERLVDACYYLMAQGQKYSFSVRANLNKLLADRRTTISAIEVEDRVHKEVETIFKQGPTSGLDRRYFPQVSTAIPNQAQLTLAIVAPEQTYSIDENSEVQKLIRKITIEYGESYRTFKNALIWCVADSSNTTVLYTEARKLLALDAIEQDDSADFDETQKKQIAAAKSRAERDLKEAVWRSYHYLMLLNKDNNLRTIDLGLVHSSAAKNLVEFIMRELRQEDEVVETIGVNYLLRNWPAFTEWSTKAVREAVFGSPRFPRLLNLDSLRTTFVQGVANGQIAYVGKKNGGYEPFFYKTELRANEIAFLDEMFLIAGSTAEAYLAAKAAASAALEKAQQEEAGKPGEAPVYTGSSAGNGATPDLQTQGAPVQVLVQEPESAEAGEELLSTLTWRGEIPSQKWTTFYLKVLSRFATSGGLKLTLQMDLSPAGGISRQKLEETRIALRELGLNEDFLEDGQ